MSKNIQEPLNVKFSPSKRIETIVDALHFLAIFACWLNALDLVYRLTLILTVLVLWHRHKRTFSAMPVHLSYTDNKGWEVSYDGSHYQTVVILETTVITSLGIFLHYTLDDRFKRFLLIPKDTLPRNSFRRLTVRLKLSGTSQHR